MIQSVAPRQTREDRAIYRALQIVESRWREPGCEFSSEKIAMDFFRLRLDGLEREVVDVAFLDSGHRLIACERMFAGTIDRAEVSPREIARRALELNAAACLMAHNHPSGRLLPSAADHLITYQVSSVLALIDVRLIDHVLVAGGRALCIREGRLECDKGSVERQAKMRAGQKARSEGAKRAWARRRAQASAQ